MRRTGDAKIDMLDRQIWNCFARDSIHNTDAKSGLPVNLVLACSVVFERMFDGVFDDLFERGHRNRVLEGEFQTPFACFDLRIFARDGVQMAWTVRIKSYTVFAIAERDPARFCLVRRDPVRDFDFRIRIQSEDDGLELVKEGAVLLRDIRNKSFYLCVHTLGFTFLVPVFGFGLFLRILSAGAIVHPVCAPALPATYLPVEAVQASPRSVCRVLPDALQPARHPEG